MYQNINFQSRWQNLIKWGRTHAIQIILILILILGFAIGLGIGILLNNNNQTSIIIDKNVKIGLSAASNNKYTTTVQSGSVSKNYVASINGNSYYPVNCKVAGRIKEENKIWFTNSQEAEAQGYKPAQNCR